MISLWAGAQNRIGFGINTGFNRIGLYYEAGLEFDLNQHQVHAGLKYYGLDYVFESNVLGMNLSYLYAFSAGSWFFGPGINASFFRETKSATELYVSDLQLRNTFGYEFNERLDIYTCLGLGAVVNSYSNILSGSSSVTSYINYEISLGIKYYWSPAADN